jgi:hypothetical protein
MSKERRDLSHGRIWRVIVSGEWAQEGLSCVEEPGEHLATRGCREEVMFVAFDNRCSFVPEVIAVKECVVDGEAVAAVGTGGVVSGVLSKPGRI